ncbi:MAG: ADP-ribosylation factor-like protein [Candidatus Helarchaeota archaeon]
MTSEILNTKKILIMGLDNSGKTSIVLSLQKKTNLLSYYSLKPTHGVDIINLQIQGKTISLWDCGGQEKYRKMYLNDLEKYTFGVDKLIFVIDVQDIERYRLALKYLSNIINYLSSQNRKVKISIFLHKFDPNLETIENFSFNKIKAELIDEIHKIIPSNFEFDIFKTTIFTVFQKILI